MQNEKINWGELGLAGLIENKLRGWVLAGFYCNIVAIKPRQHLDCVGNIFTFATLLHLCE
ncbi:hypothetical protein [Spirosoma litoris]